MRRGRDFCVCEALEWKSDRVGCGSRSQRLGDKAAERKALRAFFFVVAKATTHKAFVTPHFHWRSVVAATPMAVPSRD